MSKLKETQGKEPREKQDTTTQGQKDERLYIEKIVKYITSYGQIEGNK